MILEAFSDGRFFIFIDPQCIIVNKKRQQIEPNLVPNLEPNFERYTMKRWEKLENDRKRSTAETVGISTIIDNDRKR